MIKLIEKIKSGIVNGVVTPGNRAIKKDRKFVLIVGLFIGINPGDMIILEKTK